MSLVALKAGSALLLFLCAWLGAELPFYLQRHRGTAASSVRVLSLCNMLAAGVMLGAGALHLLPDAGEEIREAVPSSEYPWAHALFVLGLIGPLAIEELTRDSQRQKFGRLSGGEKPMAHLTYQIAGGPAAALDNSSSGADLLEPTPHARLSELPLTSAFVLLAALSFHSLLEGLAQGAAPTEAESIELLLVILLHKGLAGFALGSTLMCAAPRSRVALILTFAAATPLGVLVGMLLDVHSGVGGLVPASLTALAAGSFCYVALLEVLPRELSNLSVGKSAQLLLLGSGIAAMAGLAVWL